MQREITQLSRLLDKNGELIQKGYAKSLILEYRREVVKERKFRLKEWDYYLIYNVNQINLNRASLFLCNYVNM